MLNIFFNFNFSFSFSFQTVQERIYDIAEHDEQQQQHEHHQRNSSTSRLLPTSASTGVLNLTGSLKRLKEAVMNSTASDKPPRSSSVSAAAPARWVSWHFKLLFQLAQNSTELGLGN